MDEGLIAQLEEWSKAKRWGSLAALKARMEKATARHDVRWEELTRHCPDDESPTEAHYSEEMTTLREIRDYCRHLYEEVTTPYREMIERLIATCNPVLLAGLPDIDHPTHPTPDALAVSAVLHRLEHENASSGSAEVTELPQYVTLDQMAASVTRSKRTLEGKRSRKKDPMPDPDIKGGGGKPHEWLWDRIRPWLQREFGKVLPEDFPVLRPR